MATKEASGCRCDDPLAWEEQIGGGAYYWTTRLQERYR